MKNRSSVILSTVYRGVDPVEIAVEVDVSSGLPAFNIVGLPESAVKESRERVRSAIHNSGFEFPSKRITVNLAPADIKKEGTSLDLPIAIGILSSSGIVKNKNLLDFYFMGELSLNGGLRKVRGALLGAELARKSEKSLIVPYQNAQEVDLVMGVKFIPFANLGTIVAFLNGETQLDVKNGNGVKNLENFNSYEVDFSEVKGQAQAKRALEICSAGMHNVLMIGPPGTGKTMLAKRVPTIMPPMNEREILESTKIYSIAGKLKRNLPVLSARPFRNPHHTISDAGMAGGGQTPKPGEISLAHNGVLFLDEMPEFNRNVLEVLRQPLEEGIVSITRAGISITYPARFILIGAMNPCPCGYFNHKVKECTCTPSQIRKYRTKISGPLLDRIDLQVSVPEVEYRKWVAEDFEEEKSEKIRERVVRAVEVQKKRNNGNIIFNSYLTNKTIKKVCVLDDRCHSLLEGAARKFNLSARSLTRILKVARTIADLELSENIRPHHLAEAIQYRINLEENLWGF